MYARPATGAGFTIVETMIFLAISGLMFVLAIGAMSGKQQQTEFQTGVDNLKSELNQQLSNVADGNYQTELNSSSPSTPYIGCTGGTVAVTPLEQGPSSTPIAPDGTCTAVGEIIAFGPVNNTQESYYIMPIFGCTYANCNNSNGDFATNLGNSVPAVFNNIFESETMPFGLELADSTLSPTITPSGTPGAFGLLSFTSFQGDSATADGSNTLSSGSEHVEIFAIPNSNASNVTTSNGQLNNVGWPNNNVSGRLDYCSESTSTVCIASEGSQSEPINPSSGITFCVNSGTSGQSALFTIGGSSSTTSVSDQMYTNQGCV